MWALISSWHPRSIRRRRRFCFFVAARTRNVSIARLGCRVLPVASALLLLTVLWAACGSGGTFVSSPPAGGTPSGSYVITVTATAGKLSHAATVQLTVQ